MFILILFLISDIKAPDPESCELAGLLRDDFIIDRYTGKWYEIARSKDFPMENGECATADYSINVKGNIDILNSEILNGKRNTAKGVGYRTSSSNMLLVKFGFSSTGNYIVVDSDYENYSVVYSCSEYLLHRYDYVWILSRNKTLEKIVLDRLLAMIYDKFKITQNDLHFTDQSETMCKLN
jgi:apolipoprotein D and lipocalin family protein